MAGKWPFHNHLPILLLISNEQYMNCIFRKGGSIQRVLAVVLNTLMTLWDINNKKLRALWAVLRLISRFMLLLHTPLPVLASHWSFPTTNDCRDPQATNPWGPPENLLVSRWATPPLLAMHATLRLLHNYYILGGDYYYILGGDRIAMFRVRIQLFF